MYFEVTYSLQQQHFWLRAIFTVAIARYSYISLVNRLYMSPLCYLLEEWPKCLVTSMGQLPSLPNLSMLPHGSSIIWMGSYDTIRYNTVDLRALDSWWDDQLNLAHGTETEEEVKLRGVGFVNHVVSWIVKPCRTCMHVRCPIAVDFTFCWLDIHEIALRVWRPVGRSMNWRENVVFSKNKSSIWRKVWHISRLKLNWSSPSLKAKIFHMLLHTICWKLVCSSLIWHNCVKPPPSNRQHLSYGDCLEGKRGDYLTSSVIFCIIIVHIICTPI